MEKFNTLQGIAAPFPMVNVDTDRIIPARFLKTIKKTGLGKNLFNELRYNEDGSEKPEFILNKPAYREARILVAGDNFGCGSSREHAPWALIDFGIRCVIAPSFADIFNNNASKNGMLLIALPQETVDRLMEDAEKGGNARLSVDLEKQQIVRPDGEVIDFDIDPFKKHCLLNGLDDIALTLQKDDRIGAFEEARKAAQPWA
ncbi:MAG: 3-isopropylmalate dehydratase small subunit [Defluviicoccus sp.]|nr:3-isopropylmalate dehydratase small subunit [Defluviicoccus sp.]MDE0277317.1 3-isopropylmalate dehydratase small subunit [Defluviicoccus sp.]